MSAAPAPPARPRPTHRRLVDDCVSGELAGGARSAAALIALADDEERQGRRPAARAALERALYAFADPAEAGREAPGVLRRVAHAFYADGDADAATDCLEAALAVATAWGDEAAVGRAVNLQAGVHWQQGRMDEAERLFFRAHACAVRACDARLTGSTAQNLGILANIRGDYDEALSHYEACLADFRALGLTREVSATLNNLGLLHTARRDWDQAKRTLADAAQVSALAGDVSTSVLVDVNLGELWVAQGDFGRAEVAVRRALEGAAQTGDTAPVAQATKVLGVVAREAGDLVASEQYFTQADVLADARQDALLQAEIARERADLARRAGRNRDVLQHLTRAHRLFTQLRARPDLADVDRKLGGLEEQFLAVARRWGEDIEAKDRYTQGHCVRVADLACAVARRAGFDERTTFWFRIGALLHDVGKLVVPSEVLNKAGKLDDAEWAVMRSHTTAGVGILRDIEFPWDVRPIIESHHERWDGCGYPHGLKGDTIPLTARILCVADVYDALTSVRSYKRNLSHDETMAIMRRDVGTMFDPEVFAWFEEIVPAWLDREAAS